MPIKQEFAAGPLTTTDIQQSGGGGLWLPIDKVFEKGNDDPILWERDSVQGYWGIIYSADKDAVDDWFSIHPPPDDDVHFTLGLTSPSFNTITESKGTITIRATVEKERWFQRTGSTSDGEFGILGCGKIFFVTKNWGVPHDILSGSQSQKGAYHFDPLLIVNVNGVQYSGVVSKRFNMYDNNRYDFVFV